MKGKQVIDYLGSTSKNTHEITVTLQRKAPDVNYAKLNIDGAFLKEDGTAGAGMILRDHEGAVIFAATRVLFNCGSPLEAEMAAMDEGLRLALHWSSLPLVVETDCAELLKLVQSNDMERSRYANQINEIRRILTHDRNISLAKISRYANVASHTLACMGRSQNRIVCWLRNSPIVISIVVISVCRDHA